MFWNVVFIFRIQPVFEPSILMTLRSSKWGRNAIPRCLHTASASDDGPWNANCVSEQKAIVKRLCHQSNEDLVALPCITKVFDKLCSVIIVLLDHLE